MSEKSPKKKVIRAKGSIILELVAVLLAVALIFSLTYPNRLWKQEEENQDERGHGEGPQRSVGSGQVEEDDVPRMKDV